MGLKLFSMFERSNYPGKRAEEAAEKKEKKDLLDNSNGSRSDYNSIQRAIDLGLDKENDYNSIGEEEKVLGSDRPFATSDDVVEDVITGDKTDEDSIIDTVDKSLAGQNTDEYIETIDSAVHTLADTGDPYGYGDIIVKLFNSAYDKGDKKEINDIIDRASLFIRQYKNLLKRELPAAEEEKRADAMFRELVGDVAYIKEEGKTERVELLGDNKYPRSTKPGARKGQRIFYPAGDRIGRGFLTQAEADNYQKNKNNNGGRDKKYIKPSFKRNNGGNQAGFKNDGKLKAFNPLTGRMEEVGKK